MPATSERLRKTIAPCCRWPVSIRRSHPHFVGGAPERRPRDPRSGIGQRRGRQRPRSGRLHLAQRSHPRRGPCSALRARHLRGSCHYTLFRHCRELAPDAFGYVIFYFGERLEDGVLEGERIGPTVALDDGSIQADEGGTVVTAWVHAFFERVQHRQRDQRGQFREQVALEFLLDEM